MINKISFHISKLDNMKKYPKNLFYIGNVNLLNKQLVTIVGSRKPNQYSREIIHQISAKLSNAGICIVSGGAIGIDTIAHKSAGPSNTIMVAGTGLDKRYPAINKHMIEDIENYGLVFSQFEAGVPSSRWNFPTRNELVVSLCDIIIVAYSDLNSGTMRSIEYALKMNKKIFVLPHRIGESEGTNKLLQDGLATAIYDVDDFISTYTNTSKNTSSDEFLEYCKTNPTYDAAVLKYKEKIFEYELLAKIQIKNAKVYVL